MVLCDTNIFIHTFNGNTETLADLESIGLENIILSSVSVMELYQGMGNKQELESMKRKIRYYDVLQIDNRISALATEFIESFSLSHGLKIPDAIIGASAVTYGIELFTYNLKDFHFLPGIKLYKV